MNNTPLGSMAFGFDHTLKILGMLTARYRKYSGAIFAPKCPLFVAGHALKGRFNKRQDLFPVINTPVKISQSKLDTPIPHMWSHERFGGNKSTWYVQVLLKAVLDTSDGDVPEMIWMHLLELGCTKVMVLA